MPNEQEQEMLDKLRLYLQAIPADLVPKVDASGNRVWSVVSLTDDIDDVIVFEQVMQDALRGEPVAAVVLMFSGMPVTSTEALGLHPPESTGMEKLFARLRDILRYRLMAWDASTDAERLCGVDIETSGDEVDSALSCFDSPADVSETSSEYLLQVFNLVGRELNCQNQN